MTPRSRAFTLIELLTVIVIISILLSIVLVIAGGVRSSAQTRLTTDVIRQVDVGVESFIAEAGDLPPPVVLADDPMPGTDALAAYPLADAIDASGSGFTINSIAYFIVAAEREGLDSLFNGLPTGRIRLHDPDIDGGGNQPELRTIFDAWDQPLRFVHPAFDGVVTDEMIRGDNANAASLPGTDIEVVDFAQTNMNPGALGTNFALSLGDFPDSVRLPTTGGVDPTRTPILRIRRNAVTDSDGGLCVNGRPYIYSAGDDGDPATVEESNVYTTTPRFLVTEN